MKNLSKLGYTKIYKNISYSAEEYNIFINHFSNSIEELVPKGEGIFGTGAAIGGAKVGYHVGRRGFQIGANATHAVHRTISAIWAIIKKIIEAIKNMIKTLWLDVGKQHARMDSLVGQIERLRDNLEKQKAGGESFIPFSENNNRNKRNNNRNNNRNNIQNSNPPTNNNSNNNQTNNTTNNNNNQQSNDTFPIMIIQSMNAAGWSLARINQNVGNSGETRILQIVRNFYQMIALQADLGSPVYQLARVRNENEMFTVLQGLFEQATEIYQNNSDFTKFIGYETTLRNVLTRLRSNSGANLAGEFERPYMSLTYDNYARYVGQAFSPAGAFISTNPYETNYRKDRRAQQAKDLLTPAKVNVPRNVLWEEVMKASQYIIALFDFIVSTDYIALIKRRVKEYDDFSKILQKLANITPRQARIARQARELEGGTLEYDSKLNNYQDLGADTLDNIRNEGVGKINTTQGAGASFDMLTNILGIEDDIKAYAELGSASSTLDRMGAFQHGGGTPTEFDNTRSLVNMSNFANVDQQQKFTKRTRIQTGDVTPELIKYGVRYIQAYVTWTGNALFQEGRFYNRMCKTICDAVEEFIEDAQDGLNIDTDHTTENVYASYEVPQQQNNNTNNNNTNNNTNNSDNTNNNNNQ